MCNMEKPFITIIDDNEFYLAEDLFMYDKNYFIGCAKTTRRIVEKKNIPSTQYVYLKMKNGKYDYSTAEYKKAKLAISREWIENNMPSMSDEKIKMEYPDEPNRITLRKNDMMTDSNGNIMDLIIVGKREYDKCYFRVKSVSILFDAPNLRGVITRDNSDGYKEFLHYRYFNRIHHARNANHPNTRILYLTYIGMIRFLFASRNKKAELFQQWAAKILFTVQIGTMDQRHKLAKDLLGVPVDNAIQTLNTATANISSVYLFVIGKAGDLRDTMHISDNFDDDLIVCKFGKTEDLKRRTVEHKATFSKYTDNIKLKYYAHIDGISTTNAEKSIKKRFDEMNVRCEIEKQDELIIVTRRQLEEIHDIYRDIGVLYGANINDYKMHAEKEINRLTYENEIQKKNYEMLLKDAEIKMIRTEALKREYELRAELLESKLKKYKT